MRRSWNILACSAALLTTTAVYAAYNFSAINQSLETVSNRIVSEFDSLKTFSLALNEEATNVDEGRFALDETYTLVNLPWSEDPAATMTGSESTLITVETSEEGPESYVFDQKFEAQVDVLAMLSYYSEKTLEKCEKVEPKGLEVVFYAEGCEMAETLANADSLEVVAEAMKAYKMRVMERLTAFSTSVGSQVGAEAETLMESVLAEQQAEAQEALKQLEAFSVNYMAGKDESLVLKGSDMEILEVFKLSDFEVTLTEESMAGSVVVRFDSPVAVYKFAEPELKAFLNDLEQGNEVAVRHMGSVLKVLWGIGEQIMMLK